MTDPNPQPQSIEEGVYDLPLRLAPELEAERAGLRAHVLGAQRRLRAFAARHSWSAAVRTPFAHSVRIFADKSAFDRDLLALCGLEPATRLPATYSAALEQGVLVSVAPELYRRLYPQGDEPDAFEKLLTHELAHRLHVRLLDGDEQAMGPVWFYEGFALYAAEQLIGAAPQLDREQVWAVVGDAERGDYRGYVTVLRHFLKRADLPELVAHAGQEGFTAWLEQIDA